MKILVFGSLNIDHVYRMPHLVRAGETIASISYQKNAGGATDIGQRCIRIVFDGKSSYEPVIANLIMECKVAVNIMFADTKDIDGKAYGQMILQLPEDRMQGDKVIYYLRNQNLKVEELETYAEF